MAKSKNARIKSMAKEYFTVYPGYITKMKAIKNETSTNGNKNVSPINSTLVHFVLIKFLEYDERIKVLE